MRFPPLFGIIGEAAGARRGLRSAASEWKPAGINGMKGRRRGMRSLEREMAEIPGRAMKIYDGEPFSETLRMLAAEEKGRTSPDWLAARLENMLLSNGMRLAQMRALQSRAESLLREYRQLPEADPMTVSSFELSGILTLNSQIRQMEENEDRFRQLLQVVRDAKKQRMQITLMQALDRIR